MMAIGYGPDLDCMFCSITPKFLCLEALRVLKEMNADLKRKLPEDAPTDFIPKRLLPPRRISSRCGRGRRRPPGDRTALRRTGAPRPRPAVRGLGPAGCGQGRCRRTDRRD